MPDWTTNADTTTARWGSERGRAPDSGWAGERVDSRVDAAEGDAVFVLDEVGRVRMWSTGAEEVHGYTSDEIAGEHFSVLFREADVVDRVPDRLLREAATEGRTRNEGWRVRKDGSEFRAEMTLEALREGEDLVGYANVTRDGAVSRREQVLLDRNRRLKSHIAAISHDLTTPLAVAEGNVRLALETGDLSRLDAAVEALDRTGELLDRIGTLAKEGSCVLEPEPVDLREVAEAAWRVVETDGVDLHVEETGEIVADRSQLQQLLENLFRNGVEHGCTGRRPRTDGAADHAGLQERITVGLLDNEGFYVEDGGPGIPEDRRTAVFEAGYSGAPDGTGFGLAICEQIADAHGWVIDVSEGAAGGARFEVSTGTRP